jgi:hypothetical protein
VAGELLFRQPSPTENPVRRECQCHLRVHLVVTKYFHLGLPLVMNDYLWDPLGVKLVNWFSSLETLEADSMRFQELIREVAANPKNRTGCARCLLPLCRISSTSVRLCSGVSGCLCLGR